MIVIIAATGTNIGSITNALTRLNYPFCVSNEPSVIDKASHIILPGVGTAQAAMKNLQQENLVAHIQALKVPVLGICLGMQLLFEHSAEGDVVCLGVIPAKIVPLVSSNKYPSPHMGWNRLYWQSETDLSTDVPSGSYVYFVHGYAAALNEHTLALSTYSMPITAIVQKDNFFGMQFHPEKSSEVGLKVLNNFCNL